MSKNWTDNQRKAIDARGMQVLVSAAAGSGKTAVLTERVKNILSDTDDPCGVTEILVVTFTRAAASEMRDRIYNALKETSSLNSADSDYLRRQTMLLPTADICTIDSFCAKIVRENFSLAGVGVDFKLLDEKDIAELTENAVREVIDELYEENDVAFKTLTTMFLTERDDKTLGEVIQTLYRYSRSYPSPQLWLKKLVASFDCEKSPNETVWADIIYKYIDMFADYHCSRLRRCATLMEEAGGFNPDYINRFTATADNLFALKDAVEKRNWNGMVQLIRDGLAVKFPARNYKVDATLKQLTNDVFDEFEKDFERLEKCTLPTLDEHRSDSEILQPVVSKLCEAVERLTQKLDSKKKELNSYSFDDILHKCIDLLVVFDGENKHLTPLAETLRGKYKEILIDEYQDTNEAQNIIFEAISRDCENLYCVGDVKQSIYRFRLASPNLFMNLRDKLPDYDGEKHASQISLDKNFRSRRGIDDAVNFVFSKLMSRKIGEIDYNDREKLTFGAEYYPEKNTPDTEFFCVDAGSAKSAEASEIEATAVADYIEKLLRSGVKVTDGNGVRPIRGSDICILLRSMKNKVNIYSDALKKKNIRFSAILDGDTSESKEMRFLMSLVKVIDNPLADIPLTAVLLSPVFGFTADELAQIKMTDRNAEMFACLEKYAETSPKAKNFIDKFSLYRNISSSFPMDEFVGFLVDDTAVCDIYSAAGDGEQRVSNIRGFIKFAEDFTNSGKRGLSAFVRYIDNAVSNGSLRSYGACASDGVQIMSIHKSKGLEFPYVLLADCSKGFNRQDSYKTLTLARETGIGLKIRNDEMFTRYHTVSSAATEKAVLFGSASEELRVLYVAMTRAKEHLTFVCTLTGKTTAKRVRLNNTLSFDGNGKLHPYAVYKAGSMSEWLLSCFASHPDCEIIRDICGCSCTSLPDGGFSVDSSILRTYGVLLSDEQITCEEPEAPIDTEILETVSERAKYKYAFEMSGMQAKVTASETEHGKTYAEYFAKTKPKFLQKDFTGADRGTAIHKFLELCDFKSAYTDLEKEKQRLLGDGSMTEKELKVLDGDAVEKFFASDIGKRLLDSNEVYKEYEFAFFKKAGDLYADVPENAKDEDIVVQGKLDCAFVKNGNAVLIDYKSDAETDEERYRERYSTQIEIYTEAIERCMGFCVKERYLYSFKLKKFIEI